MERFPHCDARILHPPGVCSYCDDCPELQELRRVWGINFTGEEHEYTPDIREKLKAVEEGKLPSSSWLKSFDEFKKYVDNVKEHSRMLPCPAMYNRDQASLDAWGGNVPRKNLTNPKDK